MATIMRLLSFDQLLEERVHRLLCLPEVYQFLADGIEPPRSISKDWLLSSQHNRDAYGGGLWGLLSGDAEDRISGLVRLSGVPFSNQAELTYLLHPDQWHRGLATRMAHTAIGFCFQHSQIDTIWAGADLPNVRSIEVMKRLGMTFSRFVDYPAGKGVEYKLSARNYDPHRFESFVLST